MNLEAHLPSLCAACKKTSALVVKQSIRDGQIRWAESFACECGHGFESSGTGLPTPAARRALLAAGAGTLWVDAVTAPAKVIKVLAAVLEQPEASVKALLATLPAQGYSGTRVEAEFIGEALREAGATVRVVAG